MVVLLVASYTFTHILTYLLTIIDSFLNNVAKDPEVDSPMLRYDASIEQEGQDVNVRELLSICILLISFLLLRRFLTDEHLLTILP